MNKETLSVLFFKFNEINTFNRKNFKILRENFIKC